MAKVIKVIKKPVRALGEHLQDKANKMLRHGKVTEEYHRIRKAAEWHMRMWAWQRVTPEWKLPGETENFEATACKKVNCPNLPAGSEQCRGGVCP